MVPARRLVRKDMPRPRVVQMLQISPLIPPPDVERLLSQSSNFVWQRGKRTLLLPGAEVCMKPGKTRER